MLPSDQDIKNLALYAPRVALALVLGIPRVPFIGDLVVQFTTSAVGASPVVASLSNNLTQDALIERITYTLYQQNSFPGSPLQSLFQAQLKECPGIAVQLSVFGGPKYVINDSYTELSNLADILAVTWPRGWPLAKQSNVKMSCVLTQTPTSVPYDVPITLIGWQFLDKALDDMSDDDARQRLKAMGFNVPDLVAGCQTA
jgi:hypothetical protein